MSGDPASARPAEPVERLWHGTTRERAEAILSDGPDPDFVEPGGGLRAGPFCVARAAGPFSHGHPKDLAEAKARLFGEGGPAILEVEVPVAIIMRAWDFTAEIEFWPGAGLEELKAAWPTLTKRIL